jgi:NAD-dependent SIR2 family protein deacetylase
MIPVNCEQCTGIIKPDVVFFGEGLPDYGYNLAIEIAKDAEAMVVAGTSLNVMTPLPFVTMMKEQGKPVIIINKGRTMIDPVANVKVNADISESFVAIAESLMTPVLI